VEAKWLADIKDKQGRAKSATQLDYRSHVARLHDGGSNQSGVIVIAPAPKRYPPAHRENSVFRNYFTVEQDSYRPTTLAEKIDARAVTWEEIAERLTKSPPHAEVVQYLRWRLSVLD
jgi:hypothetical protein